MTTDAAPAGALFRARFLTVVVLPGAVLMALEIVSSRLLAPKFGNSVYVWGSIIGVFLAAMSAGYVAGGRWADRAPRLPALGRLLLAAALVQWGTALGGRVGVAAIGSWTGGRPAGTLLGAAVLFGPATFFLATVAPFAIRIAARDPQRLGGLAGRLYALSTFGSLAGTLAATFLLIPALQLDEILAILVSATALSALLCVGRSSRILAAAALLVVAGPWLTPRPSASAADVVAERITPYQTLVVREGGGERSLESDGTRHGAIRLETGEASISYLSGALAAWLFQPEVESVLALGLGTGGLGEYFGRRFPDLDLTYVEIDAAIPGIAERWFGFRSGPKRHLVLDDGRRYVETHAERYDLIYCDTYVGQSVPFHLATHEFFQAARRRLTPSGVVAVNLASSLEHPFARAMLRTMRRVYEQVLIFRIAGSANLLFLAVDTPGPTSTGELVARAKALDARFAIQPKFVAVALGRIEPDVDLSDVPVLTDAYAPVDALLNFADRGARFQAPPAP